MNRFIQITASHETLYALDDAGDVWKYTCHYRWLTEDGHPMEGYATTGSQLEELHCWEMLSRQRDFPGWPVTPIMEAEREVEDFLLRSQRDV